MPPRKPKPKPKATPPSPSPTTAPTEPADSTPLKAKLDWEGNTPWTNRLVAYLKENDEFRRRFFSDSVEVARAENRLKVETDGTSKKVLTHRLAAAIWDFPGISDAEDLEYRKLYREHEKRFETSLTGRLTTSVYLFLIRISWNSPCFLHLFHCRPSDRLVV